MMLRQFMLLSSTSPADLVASLEKIAQIPNVSQVFGSHNTLGLDPAILQEVMKAVRELRERDLVAHGTGIHQFNGFSVQF